MIDTKECTKCKEEKPLEDFQKGRNACRVCEKARHTEWRRQNPMKCLYTNTKARAKKRGIHFDLTPEYLESIRTEFCPYLGTKLIYCGEGKSPNAASLDKIIPELGYIRGNVEFISEKANRMKSDASQEELITFARSVLARYNKTNI